MQVAASGIVNFVLEAPLFGRDVVFPMLAPMGVSQLVLALWLIVKGSRSHASIREAAADRDTADERRGEQDTARR